MKNEELEKIETKKEEQPKESPPPAPPVPIRIIERQNNASLIEWIGEDGDYHRGIIPAKKIVQGRVEAAVLKKAIPYGLDWEKLAVVTVDAEKIARAMRRNGLFTLHDIEAGGNKIYKAFADAFSNDLAALIRRASLQSSAGPRQEK